MEVLALVIAVCAVAYAFSLKGDIAKLDQREFSHWSEFERVIRQLQDNGLSVADREVLDRLVSAARRTRSEQERYADDA